jgi:hypothetical protein
MAPRSSPHKNVKPRSRPVHVPAPQAEPEVEPVESEPEFELDPNPNKKTTRREPGRMPTPCRNRARADADAREAARLSRRLTAIGRDVVVDADSISTIAVQIEVMASRVTPENAQQTAAHCREGLAELRVFVGLVAASLSAMAGEVRTGA